MDPPIQTLFVVVVVVVGQGGLATRRVGTCQIIIHKNKSSNVGRFFKTGVLVALIKLEQCVPPATMLNVVPAISIISLTVFGFVISPITLCLYPRNLSDQ